MGAGCRPSLGQEDSLLGAGAQPGSCGLLSSFLASTQEMLAATPPPTHDCDSH